MQIDQGYLLCKFHLHIRKIERAVSFFVAIYVDFQCKVYHFQLRIS